ncbi:MAG: hypothetical protein MUE52_10840 [Tabrizicola sp.]|jgi:hypothetical protein|nr:hypothetical protein [Tabrizicola sp.]
MERALHLYLHSPWREAAEEGKVNLFNRMRDALHGWTFHFHPDTETERARAAGRGYGLFHMQEPTAPHILNLRRAYILPFWRIEAVADRWRFDVALAPFTPGDILSDEAVSFQRRWRIKILGEAPPRRTGTILIPLQGRLSDRRSFQSMSPIDMVETTVERVPDKTIIATLHPREIYTPSEIEALEQIEKRCPRFHLVRSPSPDLLLNCDAVVTQNSSVALNGFLADKPAVLFAESDFHHIAGSVPRDGLDAAFARLSGPPPPFARYVTWFLRRQAINGGAPDCEAQILARFRRHGWPV